MGKQKGNDIPLPYPTDIMYILVANLEDNLQMVTFSLNNTA
jgi:hypothetical protein